MGAHLTTTKIIGFEDLQHYMKTAHLINTLSANNQSCLIQGTIPCDKEEGVINQALSDGSQSSIIVIIYGSGVADYDIIIKKYNQLKSLGFNKTYIYMAGLFEWLLLQDIYGADEFPTTTKCLDILKYRPARRAAF